MTSWIWGILECRHISQTKNAFKFLQVVVHVAVSQHHPGPFLSRQRNIDPSDCVAAQSSKKTSCLSLSHAVLLMKQCSENKPAAFLALDNKALLFQASCVLFLLLSSSLQSSGWLDKALRSLNPSRLPHFFQNQTHLQCHHMLSFPRNKPTHLWNWKVIISLLTRLAVSSKSSPKCFAVRKFWIQSYRLCMWMWT